MSEAHVNAIATEINKLGLAFTYDPEFRLERLDVKNRIQVRDDEHLAPKENVERYSNQIRFGGFPPIVIYEPTLDIVDGNTRLTAARKMGMEVFPTILITKTTKEDRLVILGTLLNNRNGQALSRKESEKVVHEMLTAGASSTYIQEIVGLAVNTIGKIARILAFEARAKKTGTFLPGNPSKLVPAQKAKLGTPAAMALMDQPFDALALCASDAGLRPGEIGDVLKELRGIGNEQDQMKRLYEIRAAEKPRIDNRAIGGNGHPPQSRQLRQRLGFILKFESHPLQLLETDPFLAPAMIGEINRAITILSALAEAQTVRLPQPIEAAEAAPEPATVNA